MRVALVTGAGEGSLGEATAVALRGLGFRVLTTTRSCPVAADTHPLDLTSRGSVAELAAWVGSSADRLDVLVNNAGIHLDLRSRWREPQLVDGHEVHWRTNYLGTAQLTRLLLPRLLETAGLFLAPCEIEGLGLAVLEAMSAGVAPVAARAAGHLDVISGLDARCGYRPGDIDDAAAALRTLAFDDERRSRLASAARGRARSEFSIAVQVTRTQQVYTTAVSRRAGRG